MSGTKPNFSKRFNFSRKPTDPSAEWIHGYVEVTVWLKESPNGYLNTSIAECAVLKLDDQWVTIYKRSDPEWIEKNVGSLNDLTHAEKRKLSAAYNAVYPSADQAVEVRRAHMKSKRETLGEYSRTIVTPAIPRNADMPVSYADDDIPF